MKPDAIPAQRRKQILGLIRRNKVMSVEELAAAVDVSHPTIRRDLDWLAQAGTIERSYGGAILKEFSGTTYEPDHQITATLARREKAAIARLAVDQLRDNQSVIFDSSTTVYEAAQLAAEKKLRLTVVTNDLRIGELFASRSQVRLIVCGGTLRTGSFSLVGEPGTNFLHRLKVDVALMGIHALDEGCCYDTSLEIAQVKRYMVAAAKRVLVLADSSKFDKVAFYQAFELDERMDIVTDRMPPAAMQRALQRRSAGIYCCAGDREPRLRDNAKSAQYEERTSEEETDSIRPSGDENQRGESRMDDGL